MSINASNEGSMNFQPIEAGNYLARCYAMVHIGTINEEVMGKPKQLNKCRIMWELPTELKEFKQGDGEKPWVVSSEFTLSLHEKAKLRIFLESWRGKKFTEDEAKSFDITKLLGVPCTITIIHKTSKGGKTYAEVSGVSPVMKGMTVPPQVNKSFELNYDSFDFNAFNSLPEYVRKKMESSLEYKQMIDKLEGFEQEKKEILGSITNEDLPF